MNGAFASFLSLEARDRRDVLDAAAARLDTPPGYVEKDLWVCVVLDALFNGLPEGHPDRLFKGGTSLSKVFGLIDRFSEDIDLVVCPSGLGFSGDRDPKTADALSKKKRDALFKDLVEACSGYVLEDLSTALTDVIGRAADGCRVVADEGDPLTLLVEYPSVFPTDAVSYVAPMVKIEAGARSALDPHETRSVAAYIDNELHDMSLDVGNIRVLSAERTYWEKLLILHGAYCGYRDEGRLPADTNRISRHYYDAAKITATPTGASALADRELLAAVRGHNLIAFKQAWKRFDEAVPGSVRLVPKSELRETIERDYSAMQGMILGDAPKFGWIAEQLQSAEAAINGSG